MDDTDLPDWWTADDKRCYLAALANAPELADIFTVERESSLIKGRREYADGIYSEAARVVAARAAYEASRKAALWQEPLLEYYDANKDTLPRKVIIDNFHDQPDAKVSRSRVANLLSQKRPARAK